MLYAGAETGDAGQAFPTAFGFDPAWEKVTRDPGGLAWIVLAQDRHLEIHYGGPIATLTMEERWRTLAEERGEVVVTLTHLPFTEDAEPRAH